MNSPARDVNSRKRRGFDLSESATAQDLGGSGNPAQRRSVYGPLKATASPANLTSNLFEIEWPPSSGQRRPFPEIDRGGCFDRLLAVQWITRGQRPIIGTFYGRP